MAQQQPLWIEQGDRSHAQLRSLDALKPSLTYPGWEVDFKEAEDRHLAGIDQDDLENYHLHKLREKQHLFEGDRSHSRLVELDSHEWTYDGWEEDVKRAEELHVEYAGRPHISSGKRISYRFETFLKAMKNKQDLCTNGRSHAHLVALDELKPTLSYPGWQQDFEEAEKTHLEGEDSEAFESYHLHKLREKQHLHDGDRSHPRLIELDESTWTYPGWQDDVKELERLHCYYAGSRNLNGTGRRSYHYESALQAMKNKEAVHQEGRSHPDLVALDEVKASLTYPRWQEDFDEAEEKHFEGVDPDDFEYYHLFKLREKQKMHEGDRSHPRLQLLDAVEWSYPNWREDLKHAEEAHTRYAGRRDFNDRVRSYNFESTLKLMKHKQQIYDGFEPSVVTDTSADASSEPDIEVSATESDVHEISSTESDDNETSSTDNDNAAALKEEAKAAPASKKHRNPPLEGDCVICMSSTKSHAFIPCGHFCACQECAKESLNRARVCPICRQPATNVIAIFNA